jgi:hypothetical protein
LIIKPLLAITFPSREISLHIYRNAGLATLWILSLIWALLCILKLLCNSWETVNTEALSMLRSRGRTVSIVSDYGLDDWAIGIRSPAGKKVFCVQTGSEAHPASCTIGTAGLFSRSKVRPGRDADHSPPSSTEVKNEYDLYLLSPHAPPWRVAGLLCFALLLAILKQLGFNFWQWRILIYKSGLVEVQYY